MKIEHGVAVPSQTALLARSGGPSGSHPGSAGSSNTGATSYGSVASILKHGLDKAYAQESAPEGEPIRHANIRGRGYYH